MIKNIVKKFLYRIRGDHTTEHLISLGMSVGENFKRLNGTILDPSHCWLIKIGDNVTMAPNVHILAHDASTCYSLGYAKIGRVNIGNNVFIGASSVVLPNVNIGDNVIVGAGSVVSKSIESNGVYAGNPVKFICSYQEYIAKNKEIMQQSSIYGEEYTTRKNIDSIKKKQMIEELENGFGYVK